MFGYIDDGCVSFMWAAAFLSIVSLLFVFSHLSPLSIASSVLSEASEAEDRQVTDMWSTEEDPVKPDAGMYVGHSPGWPCEVNLTLVWC